LSTPLAPFFLCYPATTEVYTLSLHDALPISKNPWKRTIHLVNLADGLKKDCDCTIADLRLVVEQRRKPRPDPKAWDKALEIAQRSEEHTSELQSRENLVCRLLLEKKKKKDQT